MGLHLWSGAWFRPQGDVAAGATRYVPGVAGESGRAWAQADELRLLIPIFALAVAVVGALAATSSVVDLILMAIPVAAFAVWAYLGSVPLWVLSLGVVVPVVVVERSGSHQPLLFEVSVLAFVVGRWSGSLIGAVALALLAVAAPVAVGLIESPHKISVGIWILGIAFPLLIGRALFRQAQLASALEATRHELAERAMLEERRRIARDVHDFVGHGLAAVIAPGHGRSARAAPRPCGGRGGAAVGRGRGPSQHAGAAADGRGVAQR